MPGGAKGVALKSKTHLEREARVDAVGTHEVEAEGSLGDQAISEAKEKIRIATAESGENYPCRYRWNIQMRWCDVDGGHELEGDTGGA